MSFEDLRAKSATELEALLEAGDAQERLWAAWALALRSCARSEAVEHFEHEPHEGVRAHLVYVVADPARLPLLRTIAEHDPSTLVRVAACRAITRVSAPGDARWIGARAALDPSPEVRFTIIEEISPASSSFRAILARAHDDDDESVRVVAARRCVDLELDIDDLYARRDDRRVRAAIEDALFERYGKEAAAHTSVPALRVLLLHRACLSRPVPEAVFQRLLREAPVAATELITTSEWLELTSLSLADWVSIYDASGRWSVARSIAIERLPRAIAGATPEERRAVAPQLDAIAGEIEAMIDECARQREIDEASGEPYDDDGPPDAWLRARDAIRGAPT